MRNLTLYPRMGDSNIKHIESIIGNTLPDTVKDFLKKNAGLSHYERIFVDSEQTNWEVNSYVTYTELYKLTEEFLREYKRKIVPFAFDPGGWHFCLSFDESDFGAIIVNRWTDHLPEDQFLKIADNFEEFINGLKTEEEINKQ